MLGKLPLTAGGFADDFEYSGHPLCDPPSGGGRQGGGEKCLSFFFFSLFSLFIYLYRVSPRWGEALGRNKMSFFQEKIFLTKKIFFRPGANALHPRVVSRISFFFLGGGQFFSQKKIFFRREKMVFQGFLGVFRAFSTKPRSHQENPIPQSFRISWWYVASVRV